MNKIAILYGSSGGNTQLVAKQVQELFDGRADLYDVADVRLDDIKAYPYLILGTSTTGVGDLQDDWDGFLPSFAEIGSFQVRPLPSSDWATVLLSSGSFAESMRIIYDAIKDKVKIVGQVPDEGYTYDDSTAVIDGIWVGLPLDEDNEYDLTSQRLQAWVDTLKKEFV